MLAKFLPIWIAYFLAAATPGPSQVFIVENSIASKEKGRWGALGVSLGTALWVFVVAFGLSQIVNSFPGGPYFLALGSIFLLGYFAIKSLVLLLASRKKNIARLKPAKAESNREVFVKGFLVNLINPNSVVFFLSLFAPLLVTTKTTSDLAICTAGVIVISIFWYQSLVAMASQPYLQNYMQRSESLMRFLFLLIYVYFLVKMLLKIL